MVIVCRSFEFHLVHSSWETNEYHIGVWLIDKLALLYFFQAINKLCGIIVGLTSKVQPKVILEVACDLSRRIAMFGKKVPRLLASYFKFPGVSWVKEYNSLPDIKPFFEHPKVTTLMTSFQIISAALQPIDTMAFAKRAPSICAASS